MSLNHLIGFGLALISMVLYGLYMVPRKRAKIVQSTFSFWMGLGILISTSIMGVIFKGFGAVTHAQYIAMLASGLIWATGTHAYCRGVQLIGLSRSTPIKNTSAMLGTLVGIIALHEYASSSAGSMLLVLMGSLLVVISATILGRVESQEDAAQQKADSRYYIYGVLCSVWAAIAYSVWTIPMKHLYQQGISPSQFLVYMCHGCFLGMCAIALITRPRGQDVKLPSVTWRDRWLAQLSGLMWAIGSLCANIAVKHVGVAVTWPVTKNTLIAVLFGVFVLKEIDASKHKRDLNIGLILSLLGVILLGLGVG